MIDRPPTVPPPRLQRNAAPPPPATDAEATPEAQPQTGMQTADTWAKQMETPEWLAAAARAYGGWIEGQELSEADYSAAIEAVQKMEVR
jgi:hypothetical protein